jgi:hypothetical protein
VSLLSLFTLLRLVSENSDLLSLAVLQNLCAYSCTVNIRCTDLDSIVCSESNYLVKVTVSSASAASFSMKMISPSFT